MNVSSAVSVYDRMCWPDGQLELALAGGAHRRELIAYFGASEYATLASLAQQAAHPTRQRVRPPASRPRPRIASRPKIYLLPGLLGSQLGCPRTPPQPVDLLWPDPVDIVNGRLMQLRYQHPRRPETALIPLGGIAHSYLGLKLRLSARGFSVVLHDYDWRRDLSALARELTIRLEADPAEQLILIGHSMGGLLARATLAQCSPDVARRITRVIGVGAPHGGSIAAVQALRATYPAVLRLAAMDRVHDAEALTTGVFRSFPSLYQMLPKASGALDLFTLNAWPAHGAQPDGALLAAARSFGSKFAPADTRFVSIVGTGQRTVTGIARQGGQFRYEVSAAGDGTVATHCATLPGAHDYSLRCEHSELPRNERVAAALIELSLQGRTARLHEGARVYKSRCVYVTDAMLRDAFGRKLDWQRLTAATRRRYLNRLSAPPTLYRLR